MAAKPLYPHDLETQYSQNFAAFIDDINDAFLDLLLEELNGNDSEFVSDHLDGVFRANALPVGNLRKKIQAVQGRFLKSKRYAAIFESAAAIFKRADSRIIAGVKTQYEKQADSETSFPEIKFRPSKAVKEVLATNVDLIKEITHKQFSELEKTVISSVSGKMTLGQTVEEVAGIFKTGKAYAEFVARDQLAKAHAAISQERQTEAGFPGYIWVTTNDFKARHTHKLLNGTFHLWSEPPDVDGRNLHPGEDYQCRCIAKPAFGPETAKNKPKPQKYTTYDDAFAAAAKSEHKSFKERRAAGEQI